MELVAFNGVGFNAPAARGVTSQFMSFEEVANAANGAAATAGAARASGNISWASEVGAAGSHEMSVTAQSAAPEGVVTEAEGIKLHLSTKNKSGYLGVIVRPRGSNTFYEARSCNHYLGCFASAMEAAVAVARHLQATNASEVSMEEEGEEEEVEVGVEVEDEEVKEAAEVKDASFPSNATNAPPPKVPLEVREPTMASGNISWASEVGAAGSHEMGVLTPAPGGVVTEAEGWTKLHLSARSKTGYLGVFVRPRGSNTFYEASFSKHYLGCFASAVEAAVAVARHLQSLQAANASEVAMEEEGEEEEVEVGVEVEDKEVKEAVKKALDLVRLSNRNLSRNNAPLQLKKRGLADCASLFTCRHPGCGKTYSCPDAVRKHCRREHSDWLRSLPDLGPTTYCSWEWSEKH